MARSSVLADTGALVALFSPTDPWHAACVETIESLPLPLLTTAAVLTELFHFVLSQRHRADVWHFMRAGGLQIARIDEADFAALEKLMTQYHDRPMDFADATLVHVARREGLTTVFTIDNDDFETYRIDGRKRFRVLPGRVL